MKQDKRITISNILVIVGLILMIVMAVAVLLVNLDINPEVLKWIYFAGTFTVLAGRLIGMDRDASLRIKRLHGILAFSALLYCASASCMFIYEGTNNWIAFLLAGIVTQSYAQWMIDRQQGKSEK